MENNNWLTRRSIIKKLSAAFGTAIAFGSTEKVLAQSFAQHPEPPKTDHGTVPNLRFSFDDAYKRVENGGWAREVTVRELPVSADIAGVNMKLNGGQTETGVRELHWHIQPEWAYMLSGTARITAVDQQGRNFADDVKAGDLWYFPSGVPHSIQAHQDGCEFLLIFDDGSFSENNTFLITDFLAHTPKDVIAKDLGLNLTALDQLPKKEKYIFPAPVPGTLAQDEVSDPKGKVPQTFSYYLSKTDAKKLPGGSVKIIDSSNFPASTHIAAALVEVEPGGLRELHWHPNANEWQYYIEGQARMTVFASGGKARTFDYQARDVGYVPISNGHYIENTGTTTLRFLEIFKSDHYEDVSLRQWMALTPPELVSAHLNLPVALIKQLPKDKPVVVKG